MKIPEDRKPYEVIINGVKKTYAAGATVSDDAAVKEIIDNENLFPPEAPETDKPFNIPIPAPGTNVVANPELEGDEDSLTGIQIGDTKYAVGGGGGGGMLIVTFSSVEGTVTADKTLAEIIPAIQAGKTIWAELSFFAGIRLPLATWNEPAVGIPAQVIFSMTSVQTDEGVMAIMAKIEDDEGVDSASFEMQQYPAQS